MKKDDIIRAWRSPKYRRSLDSAQRQQLPTHPSEGMLSIDDDVLSGVTGGCGFCLSTSPWTCSSVCTPCPGFECQT